MTTRIEFKNTHTNSQAIRVREVTVEDNRITFTGAPALDLVPGQAGARRIGSQFLLVEVLPGSPADKPRVPDEEEAG